MALTAYAVLLQNLKTTLVIKIAFVLRNLEGPFSFSPNLNEDAEERKYK